MGRHSKKGKRIAPDRLWLPSSDWKTSRQPTAPWIRASWVSDAWTSEVVGGSSVEYVRAARREIIVRLDSDGCTNCPGNDGLEGLGGGSAHCNLKNRLRCSSPAPARCLLREGHVLLRGAADGD